MSAGSSGRAEKAIVESAISRLPGVTWAEANPVAQTVTVTYDPMSSPSTPSGVCLLGCGFECAGCSARGRICDPLHEPDTPERAHNAASGVSASHSGGVVALGHGLRHLS